MALLLAPMQLPLIGKIKRPMPWLVGLFALGIVGSTAVTILALQRPKDTTDITSLTVPVTQEDLTVRISASGTVVAKRSVNLSPKTTGRLAELFVEQGDTVSAGEIVARMESDDIEAQMMQARAAVAQAQANLERLRNGTRSEAIAQAEAAVRQAQAQVAEAQSRLNLANERVERNQYLAEEGAVSSDRLDEVLNEARSARAGVAQAEARVTEARGRLQELRNGSRPEEIAEAEARVAEARGRLQAVEVQQEDTLIRAPFSGVITQRYADPGSFVTPTTSASATESASSTSVVALAEGLEVLARVPEVDISQIRPGQPVEVIADAYPDEAFQGTVRLVAPAAVRERDVTSFEVRVQLNEGQDKLLSGMNVDLNFLGDRLQNALVVPTVAIVTKEGKTGVLVPDSENQAVFKPVTVGPSIGDQIQVLEGLDEGDRVFLELPEDQKLQDILSDEIQ